MARGTDAKAGVTIEAGVLAKAMKHAAAVVASANTIPILANVRLTAEGDALEIVTSDLDVEYRQRLPLTEPGALATTVDARRLAMLASAVAATAPLTLELEGSRLTVKAGRSRWQLPVLPTTDFPVMPFDDATVPAPMDSKWLAQAIARCAPSVGTEKTRDYLNGTFFNADDGKLRLTSTDGHRGMSVDTGIGWPDDAPEVIVGPKLLRIVQALAEEGAIALAWDRGKMRAVAGEVTVTGKTIDGTFPDYRRVWPQDEPAPVRVDPGNLRAAIRRVALVASEKTRAVKLEWCDGLIRLSVASPEGGTACEEIPAECVAGFETGFNAQYLEAMGEAIGGETIEIHHHDAGSVAKFVRVPRDGACGVVMPMRV